MIEELKLEDETIDNILIITKALSTPTRYKILKILSEEEKDISELAKDLKLTEANISAQVKHLDKAGLISCRYEPGEHGVRKLCRTKVSSIIIKFPNNNMVDTVRIDN
jgi:predicted transcriptional regulator